MQKGLLLLSSIPLKTILLSHLGLFMSLLLLDHDERYITGLNCTVSSVAIILFVICYCGDLLVSVTIQSVNA